MQRREALDALLEAASEQGGYVTAGQAKRLGLAPDDVTRLLHSGDLRRVRRGVFGMRHADDRHADEIAAWLHFERDRLPWERRGASNVVLSHETAAALHGLGTLIPQLPTVTVAEGTRRSARAEGIEVRHLKLRDADWRWWEAETVKLPVTTPARTIVDLVVDDHEPSYVRRAAKEALTGRLTTPAEVVDAAQHRKNKGRSLKTRLEALLREIA